MKVFRFASLVLVLFGFALAPIVYGSERQSVATNNQTTTAVTIPFELANRTIFIKVQVGTSRSLWFVLDTGDKYAAMDLEIAKSLGVDLGEPVPVGGAAGKTIFGQMIKSSTFRVVGLQGFEQPLFIAIPLHDLAKASGHEFAGILGYDFIKQFVVEIDYIDRTVTLREPSGYDYQGDGETFPIIFNAAGHPQLQAEVLQPNRPPLAGTFVVDLGSGAAVILNTPFVNTEGLLRTNRATVPWLEGRALGGAVSGVVGRVQGFKIGRFLIKDPIVVFSQTQTGPLASADAQGNIGAAVLDKFKVILDYTRNRLILEPNSQFADRIEYNRTGLSLVSDGERFNHFVVDAVANGSPASKAGLKPGDEILGIDGKPVTDTTLWEIRLHFKTAQHCSIRVRRLNKEITVELVPHAVI